MKKISITTLHRTVVFTVVVGVLAGLGLDTQADIIAYDGFADGGTADGRADGATSYTTSPASSNGLNNDSLHTQNPISTGFTDTNEWNAGGGVASTVYFQAQSGGLTYDNFRPDTSGQARFFRSSGTTSTPKIATRSAVTTDTSDVQWLALLVNFDTSPTDWYSDFTITLNYEGAFASPVFGIRQSDGKGFFDATTGASAQDAETATALSAGTHLFLFKFDHESSVDSRYDDVTMWVDPVLTVDPNDLTGGLSAVSIMRQSTGLTDPTLPFTDLRISAAVRAGNEVVFDEFILTTDYSTIAIPEPSTLTLVGLGLVGLLLPLRRRQP